jgi:N-acetylglucosaminyldiphosphoundecaprenol N-acetyl-beta-D-mannosaminyltransferase
MRKFVVKAPVDVLSKDETIRLISSWIESDTQMRLVVTAYSEFYVRAKADPDFMKILQEADMVTPDGVSILAAVRFGDRAKGRSVVGRFWEGLKTGGEVLSGKVGETVTGVWLFENLTKLAADKGWKVFLLGGWDNVSLRTSQMLLKRLPKINVEYDAGEERVGTDEKKNKEVIEKINKFSPDILFVAYNPIKQEKWLAKYSRVLKVKVGIGVGGTFNEYLGEFKKAPAWMEKSGLKWLWRVIQEPKRLGRIVRAVLVFPWLVFKNDHLADQQMYKMKEEKKGQ